MEHHGKDLNLTVTIVYHRAVLGGRHQRLVIQVHLVSVVANADLELDEVFKVGHHGTGQEDDTQPIL